MRNRDPQGHYAALNVHPDASDEEIQLAYQFLKRAHGERRGSVDIARVRAAYAQIGRREGRAFYDRRSSRRPGRSVAGRLGATGVLSLLLAALALVLLWSFAPALRASLVHFTPGDELSLKTEGRPLGTVQRYEPDHVFHNGSRAPAYLVEPQPGAPAVWYPARDLARIARRR